MSILPAIDTVYTSLAAFKLDIFGRGEQHGITYVTKVSKSNQLWLQCNAGVGTSPCGHSIQAKEIREGRGVKVLTIRQDHTCSRNQLEANFQNPVMLKNRKARLKAAKEEVPSIAEESQHEAEDVGWGTATQRVSAQIATKKLTRDELPTLHEEDLSEEDEQEDEDEYTEDDIQREYDPEDDEMKEKKVKNSGQFLSAEVLRSRAARLLEDGTRIQLPQHSQGFQDPNELLVLWHAFARQEGFLLVRTSKNSARANLRAECLWNRNKDWHHRCLFYVQAKKSFDGLWYSLSSTTLVHNHTSKAQSPHPPSSASTSVPSSTAAFPPHPFIVQAQSLSSNAPPPPISQAPSSLLNLTPSWSEPHPSDLVNFLRSFDFSPSTIFETLSILRMAGVDSLEVFVALLSMAEANFLRFVDSIGGEAGNRLKLVAKKMRERAI
ncbi:hypothetical protein JCM3765_000689 [Sporobolomyces pararoseus]